MLPSVGDDGYRFAVFYSGCTCVYFPFIISVLYFTNYFYNIGKYSFLPIIGVILVTECTKYLIGTYRIARRSGRYDEKYSTKKNNTKNKIKECLKCCVLCGAMVGVYFTIAVLFGAQVFDKHEETIMLGVLLCVLTVFPSCLNIGASSTVSLLFGHKLANDIVNLLLLRNVQLTISGAWLGAFVIPLDWDRPWQEWPIPCSMGALLGFIAANLFTLVNTFPKITKKGGIKSGRKQR